MADELRDALKHAVCDELAAALGRIAHCVGQISDQQVWARSTPGMNSIGNLMLHLAGNVQQLIVSGLGGVPDDRDRPAEFAAREPISSDELLGKLLLTVKRAQETFRTVTTEDLCGPLKLTKYDLTGLQAAIRCIAHFRGHTQEIIHMTRELLGDKYEFAGPR